MLNSSSAYVVFVLANAVLGALVGALSVRSPGFAALPIPTLGWIVLALLVTDLGLGALARAHPWALITMPVRFAALVASYIACVAVMRMFPKLA